MLNPNDIASKKFEKSMGRYRPEDVDHYLSEISGGVLELLDEKRSLEQKLLVLADKLEEYKRDEDSLHSALLGAQKLGDSVVRDSKAKAQNIIEDAKIEANMMIENAKRSLEKEQSAFIRLQREVATFKSRLQLTYKQHLELISSISVDSSILGATQKAMAQPPQEPLPPEPQVEEPELPPEDEPQSEYDISLPDVGAEVYTEELLEYVETDDGYQDSHDSEQSAKRESRFGPLKFGKEFDIKRDDEKRKK